MTASIPAGHPANSHRRAAKDLLRRCRAEDPDAVRRYQAVWLDPKPPSLQRCQHVIAKESGAEDWDDLVLRSMRMAGAVVIIDKEGSHVPEDIARLITPAGSFTNMVMPRAFIDEWFRRRGVRLHPTALEQVHERVTAAPETPMDRHAWEIAWESSQARVFDNAPSWVAFTTTSDAVKQRTASLPFALPLGIGRWMGGRFRDDDLRQVSLRPMSEWFWRAKLCAIADAVTEETAPLSRHDDPATAMILHWQAVAERMRSDNTVPMQEEAAQVERWGSLHPIAIPWRQPIANFFSDGADTANKPHAVFDSSKPSIGTSWRSRALLVSGDFGSGKTVWVKNLLDQLPGISVLAFDQIGDLPGQRLSPQQFDDWAQHGSGRVVIDVPDFAGLPARLPTFSRPVLIVVHGVRVSQEPHEPDDDQQTIERWIRTTRHVNGDRVFFVVSGHVGPDDFHPDLFTDHLAFRNIRWSWPSLERFVSRKQLASLQTGEGWLTTAEGGLYRIDGNHQLPHVPE